MSVAYAQVHASSAASCPKSVGELVWVPLPVPAAGRALCLVIVDDRQHQQRFDQAAAGAPPGRTHGCSQLGPRRTLAPVGLGPAPASQINPPARRAGGLHSLDRFLGGPRRRARAAVLWLQLMPLPGRAGLSIACCSRYDSPGDFLMSHTGWPGAPRAPAPRAPAPRALPRLCHRCLGPGHLAATCAPPPAPQSTRCTQQLVRRPPAQPCALSPAWWCSAASRGSATKTAGMAGSRSSKAQAEAQGRAPGRRRQQPTQRGDAIMMIVASNVHGD
jgi:hypothetical protein